jgi:hypothetical protein
MRSTRRNPNLMALFRACNWKSASPLECGANQVLALSRAPQSNIVPNPRAFPVALVVQLFGMGQLGTGSDRVLFNGLGGESQASRFTPG